MAKFFVYSLAQFDEDNMVMGPFDSYELAEKKANEWFYSLPDDEIKDSSYDIICETK